MCLNNAGEQGIAEVFSQESGHLPPDLQVGDTAVQVDPIQAFKLKHDMPIQDVVNVDHLGHPPSSGQER
jgi:hypothetical protein